MASPNESSPTATATLAPGTLIAERYRVDSVLGEGGMGVVYLAEHVHIRKRYALKVLLSELTTAPEAVARFEREAVAAGAISHPNVASATDFGRLADGSFFLVLEYLEGRTLRSELDAGALPALRALAIARGVALGISAAHAKGIVHRDLKPENVMLVTRDGDRDFVKVLDFGIARLEQGTSGDGTALTSAGAILGTPHYMAPEQALGAKIDARADLYALGVILYEMLTGDCPFKGAAMTLMRQHLLTPVPPLPAPIVERVPAGVQPLVARLLAKEPAARYASAAEVVAALDECIAPPAAPVSRATDFGRAATRLAIAETPVRRPTVALLSIVDERASRAVAWLRGRPRAALLAAGAGVAALVIGVAASSRTPSPVPTANLPSPPVAPPSGPSSPPLEEDPGARSDAVLSCLDGRFADRVEQGQPAGDAQGIVASRRAIYWVDLANRGRPTHVTLVWTIDGKEVQRQTLSVGRAPHWRTWGAHKVDGARAIDVQVLDAAGRPLKADSLTLEG